MISRHVWAVLGLACIVFVCILCSLITFVLGFISLVLAKRLGRKNVSEMTYFVQGRINGRMLQPLLSEGATASGLCLPSLSLEVG